MFRRKQKPEEPPAVEQPLDPEEQKKREDFERRKKRARVAGQVFEHREAQKEQASQRVERATEIMHSLLGSNGDNGAALERIEGTPPLFLEGLSNTHLSINGQFDRTGTIVNRWSIHGDHTGELLGVPPTWQELQIGGVTLLEIKDGELERGWMFWDVPGVIERLKAQV
jgi:SnoaL-like polyketide cyclase